MTENEQSLLLKVLARQTKINGQFPYSLLGVVLPPKYLLEFISVFGGSTFTVPTLGEVNKLVKACAIYELGGYDKSKILCKGITDGITRNEYNTTVAKFD